MNVLASHSAPVWLILLVYAPLAILGVGLILLEAERQKIIPGNEVRFRKLRFAWSASCGIACVLLIVLLVHDYRDRQLIASLRYAFPVLISFGLALAPWASSTRFSLRTLLVAMTLLAMALEIVVWAGKYFPSTQ